MFREMSCAVLFGLEYFVNKMADDNNKKHFYRFDVSIGSFTDKLVKCIIEMHFLQTKRRIMHVRPYGIIPEAGSKQTRYLCLCKLRN